MASCSGDCSSALMAECGGRTWPRSAPLQGDYSYSFIHHNITSTKDRQEARKLPQYNGYCVQFECIEGLLCDVVIADVILQGQVEPVLLVDQIEARIRVHLVGVPQPPVAAALPASETCHVSNKDVSRPGPTCPRTARTRGPRSAAPAAARSGPAHSRCGSATQTRPRVRGLW